MKIILKYCWIAVKDIVTTVLYLVVFIIYIIPKTFILDFLLVLLFMMFLTYDFEEHPIHQWIYNNVSFPDNTIELWKSYKQTLKENHNYGKK